MSKMRRFLTVLLAVAFAGSLGLAGSGQASAHQVTARHHGAAMVYEGYSDRPVEVQADDC